MEHVIKQLKQIRTDAVLGKKKHYNAADRKRKYDKYVSIGQIVINALTGTALLPVVFGEGNKIAEIAALLLAITAMILYVGNSNVQDILKMEADQEKEFDSLLRKQMGESNVNATKFIVFCRKTLFLEVKEINWEANVWYVEKLNVASEKYSLSSTIESFSF